MADVSVIIPVYNVEDYIDRCLKSVTSQTFSNIEIIIVNDGSTDGSGEKCLDWAKRDDRIIYASKKNEGLGPTRNLGIQMASAEFVAFCDSDDWYDERYIELMLAKQGETEADIVICGRNEYDACLNQVTSVIIPKSFEGIVRNWAWKTNSMVWLKLFRKSLFVDNDIKMPAFIGEDTAIHYYIMTKAKKIEVVEQALYYYLINRPGSLASNYQRHASYTVRYLTYVWNLFIRDNIFEEYKKDLFEVTLGQIIAWHHKIKDDSEYAEKWLTDCMKALKEYFGDMVRAYNTKLCVAGSYSLFNCSPRGLPILFSNQKTVNEYCFSGLISYTSNKPIISPIIDNPFRQTALERDFQKILVQDISLKQFDYIILDFLDERFDIAEASGGYYTISDTFEEADIPFSYTTLKRDDAKTVEIWEEKCLGFIAFLKEKFPADRIILVKNFLTETFGSEENRKSFENIDDIRRANAIITKCYNFFEANCSGITVIDLGKGKIFYSDENFRHGCVPWHYNQAYYLAIREMINNFVIRREERQVI